MMTQAAYRAREGGSEPGTKVDDRIRAFPVRRERPMVCSGRGLYYEQFPKDGHPNHPETFLRQIRDYEERFFGRDSCFYPRILSRALFR
jgi:hypothetical protein